MSKTMSYYTYDKVMSYNAIFNMIVGARGLGKTYGAKKRVITDWIKRRREFIYLRRFSTETKASKNSFFADIAHEFPDWDFRVEGYLAQASSVESRGAKKREWHTMGYFRELTGGQKLKSVSYPNVYTIIFDEFIIERGSATHYLPDETTALSNFYSTVDRWNDRVRVFLLANSVSIDNPYFLEWDITPDDGELQTKRNGFVLVHFPASKDFQGQALQTRFGQFIGGTDYGDYAAGNTFADNHKNLIAPKDPAAIYYYTIETRKGAFSCWWNAKTNIWYMQEKRPGQEILYTMDELHHDVDKLLVKYSDKQLAYMRSAYRRGDARFDSPRTRNQFAEIFKR